MMARWRLKEIEAGELLHDEEWVGDELAAERRQADRWTRYSGGEPRVSSRLYVLESGHWRLRMTIGV
jgi:hypothetical protein